MSRLLPLDVLSARLRVACGLVLAAVPLALLGGLARSVGPLPAIAAALLATPILTPALTPLCAEIGLFRYHARFLLAMPAGRRRITLHLGTGLDRIVRRRELGGLGGPRVRARVLASALEGLLALGAATARGDVHPETEITATSYFFSARTARRLGFEIVEPGPLAAALFLLGYVDAAFWLSLTNRRLSLPRLGALRQVCTTAATLALGDASIRRLRRRLEVSVARLPEA